MEPKAVRMITLHLSDGQKAHVSNTARVLNDECLLARLGLKPPGPNLNIKIVSPGVGISMFKIIRSFLSLTWGSLYGDGPEMNRLSLIKIIPCNLAIKWMLTEVDHLECYSSKMLSQLKCFHWKQGKSEGFESCDRPLVLKRPIWGQNRWCFVPCDLEIWLMTLENIRASLLCCFKLCATFHSHRWIQTGVTVRNRPIWVKFNDFFSRVTLKFDRWPWKTIGHLFNATSSFVHHLVAICEFKLELQSGNAQFGSKSTIFLAVWPCNLTYDLKKQ